jgi:hypothetical protein
MKCLTDTYIYGKTYDALLLHSISPKSRLAEGYMYAMVAMARRVSNVAFSATNSTSNVRAAYNVSRFFWHLARA